MKTDFRIYESFSRCETTWFELIFLFAKYLTDLIFVQYSRDVSRNSLFSLCFKNCTSSTLTKLKIDVNTIDDCLYVVDGRFDCLSTLIIDIKRIRPLLSDIDTTVKNRFIISN